jgi:hypothetical protein
MAYASALDTFCATVRVDVDVGRNPRVAVLAVRTGLPKLVSESTLSVFLGRHGLKVIGVYAASNPAEMVDLHAVGQPPARALV